MSEPYDDHDPYIDQDTADAPVTANDAEISLLGAALSGADIHDALTLVQPADFYHPVRGEVWETISRVHRSGGKPDVISVRMALTAGSKVDPIEMFDWTQKVPLIANVDTYALGVVEAAGSRALEIAGREVARIGRAGDDLALRRERARQIVDAACAGREVNRARRLADVMPAVLDVAQHGQTAALSTGWPDVDDIIGGIAPGRLVIVGARPGVGKSVMGTNLALHVAHHHGHAALLSSLEMPELEVGQRMLANHARVNLGSLMSGRTSEDEWGKIAARQAELDAMPITVDDASEQTVTSIRKAARDVQRTRDDLALIVVDYLQLVRAGDSRANRAEQIGEISRGLKLLARESGACVVAMAQVNRDNTRRNDKPRMSDLRESGSIEADADQVILLHHDDNAPGDVEVIVDKNRHGKRANAVLQLWGHFARLETPRRKAWTPSGVTA